MDSSGCGPGCGLRTSVQRGLVVLVGMNVYLACSACPACKLWPGAICVSACRGKLGGRALAEPTFIVEDVLRFNVGVRDACVFFSQNSTGRLCCCSHLLYINL